MDTVGTRCGRDRQSGRLTKLNFKKAEKNKLQKEKMKKKTERKREKGGREKSESGTTKNKLK